jgi:selenocysteine lyase/cysteine desulfurase
MLGGAPGGSIDLAEAEKLLVGARLLVINAASNVLGTELPVAALTGIAHAAGAIVLVDAAQSAGHLPANAQQDNVDMVAFTGHKGLLGIQGIGGLWVRDGIEVDPLLTGGTGGDSKLRDMPPSYPDHLEAGTLCAPAIAALLAGVEWVLSHGVSNLHERTSALKTRLWDGLSANPELRVLSPRSPEGAPLVTFVPRTMDVPSVAMRLDREHGILTRAGLHGAPEAHRLLGSDSTGAVRLSLGWCTTEEEVDRAIEAVAEVTGTGRIFSAAAEAPSS